MKKKLIMISKDILGGIPVFVGTRVPVRALIDYLEANKSLSEFLDDFPSVSRSQAINVLELIVKNITDRSYERVA